MKRCFLFGHSDTPSEVYPDLLREIERHVLEFDVTEFVVGHYGAFDRMAARALAEVKQKYPGLCLMLLVPYLPWERPMELPDGFDTFYAPDLLETVPKPFRIVRANRGTIKAADFVITYFHHRPSRLEKIYDYAERCHKGITILPKKLLL